MVVHDWVDESLMSGWVSDGWKSLWVDEQLIG